MGNGQMDFVKFITKIKLPSNFCCNRAMVTFYDSFINLSPILL